MSGTIVVSSPLEGEGAAERRERGMVDPLSMAIETPPSPALQAPSPLKGEGTILLLADTCLLWGHRLSEWCGHGPQLEEDIALTNTALDMIGQARSLYKLHATRVGNGVTEDKLAYFRDPHEFKNVALAEIENGDYAQTILRSLLLSAWFVPLWTQLAESDDIELAAIASESVKASRVQLRHASDWTIRFGDGTNESRQRIEAAIATLAPHVNDLLATEIDETDRNERVEAWFATIERVINEATLQSWPREVKSSANIERNARASLLAEMQSLAREHPNATW
jgi:ring-1,2-phenylacetyl-CoA epoxidase subunit PaaC